MGSLLREFFYSLSFLLFTLYINIKWQGRVWNLRLNDAVNEGKPLNGCIAYELRIFLLSFFVVYGDFIEGYGKILEVSIFFSYDDIL